MRPCPLLLEIHQRIIAIYIREGDGQNFTSRIVRNGGYGGSQSVPILTQHTLDVLADGVEEVCTARATGCEIEIQIAYKAIHRIQPHFCRESLLGIAGPDDRSLTARQPASCLRVFVDDIEALNITIRPVRQGSHAVLRRQIFRTRCKQQRMENLFFLRKTLVALQR